MQEVAPVSRKIKYRTVDVHSVDAPRLSAKLGGAGSRCIVAVDIAKEKMVAGFANAAGVCESLVHFSHPTQTLVFISLLVALRELGLTVEVAMEPTGVYGSSLRHQLTKRSFAVFRVDPNRAFAMRSVLDGVPSVHDAKACTLIAYLHAQQLSSKWRERDDRERKMRALMDERRMYETVVERGRGHIEAVVSEFFPELSVRIDHSCGWHLFLLERFPSPAQIAAAPQEARDLLRRVSRGQISATRIAEIISAAEGSLGAPMSEDEARRVSTLATLLLQYREALARLDARIHEAVGSDEQLTHVAALLGPVATAAILADLGDPSQYGSSAALEKAFGLNLKETSSGTSQSPLRITKRGAPRPRKYLFLAVLRLIQSDPIVRAWYEARSSFKAGDKLKAVVAVMRKIARAIVHLARGTPFDAAKLFDVRRLTLPPPDAVAPVETPTSLA